MVLPRNVCGANPKISAIFFFLNSPIKPTIKECTSQLYVTSIGRSSLREFGDESKGEVKHPGMIDC